MPELKKLPKPTGYAVEIYMDNGDKIVMKGAVDNGDAITISNTPRQWFGGMVIAGPMKLSIGVYTDKVEYVVHGKKKKRTRR